MSSSPPFPDGPIALRLLIRLLGAQIKGSDAPIELASRMSDRDWDAFLRLALERHKTAPLISAAIATLSPPGYITEACASATEANAIRVLHQISDTRTILIALQHEGVEALVLKGWPLSEDLFGSTGLRQARDIDLMVAPEDLPVAAEALLGAGFEASRDHPEHFRLLGSAELKRERNNLTFTNPVHGSVVELHWRCHQFIDWPELFASGQNWRTQTTSAGPVSTPTEQANLIYLSLHGSLHRWSRLKWLCDIAALAWRRGEDQLTRDLELAASVDAYKPLALGLTLAARLFGSPCPNDLLRRTTWLERKCLEEITRPEAVPESLAHRMKFYAMTLALANDMPQRLAVLRYRFWGKRRLARADRREAA